MAVTWSERVRIAAIDAGSNAIRLVISRADSATQVFPLAFERCAVRLGHHAFTQHRFDRLTIARAVEAFRQFRSLLDRYGVERYRAVTTSAAREARNRADLKSRIYRETGIRLEVISSSEEARLVRSAVLRALGENSPPRLIVDLGGGSLEISLLKNKTAEQTIALPLGTVRLMETFGMMGAFSEDEMDLMRRHVLALLESFWPLPPDLEADIAVACGGNAEALARLAPGPRVNGIETLNLRLLGERLWPIVRLDVRERMRAFGVRRDRAEVMGIGAIVLTTLGNWLGLRSLLVPGVGVREGILGDLALARFSAIRVRPRIAGTSPVLREARRFAARMHSDSAHVEQVRRLAASLFDQLLSLHDLPSESRLPLEVSALLHDVGYAVNPKAHHKHGEYLARHARIAGLDEQQRILIACLVRYHGTSEPEPDHKLYSGLDTAQQEQVRLLAAILRVAVALDESRQSVDHVQVVLSRKEIRFEMHTNSRPAPAPATLRRAASFFQREFATKVRFTIAREQAESVLMGQGKGRSPLQAA